MNRNYGKMNDGSITYAPETLYIDGKLVLAPRAEHFAAAGWLKIYDEKPVEKEGVRFIPSGWEARDGAIYRTYREEPLVPPAPPAIRYSGWKMYKALKAEGFGDAFDALMKSDIGVMIAFVRPQYFLSNDDDFTSMMAKLCTALGIDDETKERILAASVDEEVGA